MINLEKLKSGDSNMPNTSAFMLIVFFSIILTGCKADKVEVDIDSAIAFDAAKGTPSTVPFEASVGEKYTKIDDEKRTIISKVETAVRKHFPGVEVEVEYGADEYTIEIEGEIAISNAVPAIGAPWFVSSVSEMDGNAIVVSLQPSGTFDAFSKDLTTINIMLGADKYQPVEFKVSGKSVTIMAGGAYVEGRPETFTLIKLVDSSVKLLFSGGPWEQAAGGFLMIEEKIGE